MSPAPSNFLVAAPALRRHPHRFASTSSSYRSCVARTMALAALRRGSFLFHRGAVAAALGEATYAATRALQVSRGALPSCTDAVRRAQHEFLLNFLRAAGLG